VREEESRGEGGDKDLRQPSGREDKNPKTQQEYVNALDRWYNLDGENTSWRYGPSGISLRPARLKLRVASVATNQKSVAKS